MIFFSKKTVIFKISDFFCIWNKNSQRVVNLFNIWSLYIPKIVWILFVTRDNLPKIIKTYQNGWKLIRMHENLPECSGLRPRQGSLLSISEIQTILQYKQNNIRRNRIMTRQTRRFCLNMVERTKLKIVSVVYWNLKTISQS